MKGQSMIEVIIALTLIILFLSGIVVIELYAIRNADFSRNKSISSVYARQQLERARAVRDTAGINALTNCLTNICYINAQLTPVMVTPTGTFSQSFTIKSATIDDCPIPQGFEQPGARSYKATTIVSWAQGATHLTPPPRVELSTCLTDWN